MRADDFVQSLRAQAPTREELLEYGLSDREIQEIQSTFSAQRRKDVPPALGYESELERLLRLYDCSTVEISQVHLNKQLESHPAGRAVARWEADPVVLLPSGELAAFDHAELDQRIADVSADSERFLAAMAALATLIRERDTWKGRAADATKKCVDLAGGERYLAFFQSLCAFLDE